MAAKTKTELEKEIKRLKQDLAEAQVAAGEDIVEVVPREEHEKAMAELEEKFRVERDKARESEEAKEAAIEHEISQKTAEQLKVAVDNMKNGKALLFKKMSLALAEVQRIPKTGFNKFHDYKYATEGDILDGIRPILADVGLAVFPTVEKETRAIYTYYSKGYEKGSKTVTKVEMMFTIACTDTGETIQTRFCGEGEDEGDKGLYKAYTGATKYFLTKTFLISSGDITNDNEPTDPEADTHRYNDDKNGANNGGKQNQRQSYQQTNKTPDKPADDPKQATKAQLIGYWKLMGYSEEDFADFYTKQMKKGLTHNDVAAFLQKKIKEKQEETAKEKGNQDVPNDNDAPPEDEQQQPDPNVDKQQPEQKQQKNPDDMTPEEYADYVESALPFPLTESEKNKVIEDARKGVRNRT